MRWERTLPYMVVPPILLARAVHQGLLNGARVKTGEGEDGEMVDAKFFLSPLVTL